MGGTDSVAVAALAGIPPQVGSRDRRLRSLRAKHCPRRDLRPLGVPGGGGRSSNRGDRFCQSLVRLKTVLVTLLNWRTAGKRRMRRRTLVSRGSRIVCARPEFYGRAVSPSVLAQGSPHRPHCCRRLRTISETLFASARPFSFGISAAMTFPISPEPPAPTSAIVSSTRRSTSSGASGSGSNSRRMAASDSSAAALSGRPAFAYSSAASCRLLTSFETIAKASSSLSSRRFSTSAFRMAVESSRSTRTRVRSPAFVAAWIRRLSSAGSSFRPESFGLAKTPTCRVRLDAGPFSLESRGSLSPR
jgi:hypothetical protein